MEFATCGWCVWRPTLNDLRHVICCGAARSGREKWGAAPTDAVALFAGMNYRLKGLEPLLHAVGRMWRDRPLLLLVAGSPKTAPFERLAKRLGVADRVRFIGYCDDMRNAYFAADFFVHPTFYDPCSNVVLEAMACGLPVTSQPTLQ